MHLGQAAFPCSMFSMYTWYVKQFKAPGHLSPLLWFSSIQKLKYKSKHAIQFQKGEFDETKDIPQENLTSDNEDFMGKRNLSQDVIHCHTENYQVSYISSFPAIDVHIKDRRVKASFER